MATGEGGKSNFADTGGYGGNFNAGGGGLYNQSASFGGNPTTVSGGVGDYGARQAAASRLNTSASSMNSSANAMMKANGYVLNQNGVWVEPGAWTGLPTPQPKPTPTTITQQPIPPIVPPPVVPPQIPIPRAKPKQFADRIPPDLSGKIPDRIAPGGRNTWGGMIGDYSGGHGHNMRGGGFLGTPGSTAGSPASMTGSYYEQQGNRQFGGPVAPGGQYTVGENGPETLQMGANGGGQVIPHNPMDRLGGMNPQMMQQLFQMMQQFRGGQGGLRGSQMGQQPPPQGGGAGPGGGLPPGPGQQPMPQSGFKGWGMGGNGLGMPGIMSRFS